MKRPKGITARPYHLLCAVCAIGEGRLPPRGARLRRLLDAVRADPEIPVTVRCNAGRDSLFGFQDIGHADDTPEGADYNQKRDMDILHRLDLPPGITLPARTLFVRVYDRIGSSAGICGYGPATSKAWTGCRRARRGFYEKGHAAGFAALIPPRGGATMRREQARSLSALRKAVAIPMQPHLLLCSVCQYGRGNRPPFAEDNLPEFLDIVFHRNPGLRITLVPGAGWMMCAPCPWRAPKRNACYTGRNGCGGLYNQRKNLNVMQALGLAYGDTLTARQFYRLALAKIPRTEGVCALDNAGLPPHSPWWNACDAQVPQRAYRKGRAQLLAKMRAWDRR